MSGLPGDIQVNNDYCIPGPNDLVYKDESVFSFDTPESEAGIYICLKTFLSIDSKHLKMYSERKRQRLFLKYEIRKTVKEESQESEETVAKKPTRMALGVEGGFQLPEHRYNLEEHFTLVCLSPTHVEIPQARFSELSPALQQCVTAIQMADSAVMAQEKAQAAQWAGQALLVSKFADNLKQLDNGCKIPPSGWKCEKCDLRENLWLNLTDGSILCGRRQWDGTGGNNHALEHYEQVKYPLAVKLGTITPQGADVYSYAEDDMVLDPHLSQHLAHFHIDIMKLEKSDKSMVELEVEANDRMSEWLAIQESNTELKPLFGPGGFTGMRNLGNSCYLNSTMQVIFTMPDFVNMYAKEAESIFVQELDQIQHSFPAQMAKLGHCLLSGDYSKPQPSSKELNSLPPGSSIPPPVGIQPHMFKLVVGSNHPEFSTKNQQDVQEFILHLVSLVERDVKKRRLSTDPLEALHFQVEERLQCGLTSKVRYSKRKDLMLSLPIPMDETVGHAKPGDLSTAPARPQVPFMSCLRAFASEERIDGFRSPASVPAGAMTFALKRTRFATFPDYLCVQVRRFTLTEDWVPKKLDVELVWPEDNIIDLSLLKAAGGVQPGEVEMPADTPAQTTAAAPAPAVDESVVNELVNMGFPPTACRKAVVLTQNSGMESAVNWIMEHMGDPDFEVPLPEPTPAAATAGEQVSQEALTMLIEMGFSKFQATEALRNTGNNLERAADYGFTHMEELALKEQQEAHPQAAPVAQTPTQTFRNGPPKYRLFALISHMGTSTHSGHYVCHIFRKGRWVIYNDEKVAASENPPKGLAYVYWLRRADLPDPLA